MHWGAKQKALGKEKAKSKCDAAASTLGMLVFKQSTMGAGLAQQGRMDSGPDAFLRAKPGTLGTHGLPSHTHLK